ncbi:uncharacterized protein LOC143445519 isoform X2 [Clavelina lepadiformis]|uniref:uncharacterized protein LOC143445519 isoform X2 n=1 Tax=Clavelina lepadiformis TaxID=159417 RepID=UPI004041E7E5
MSDDLLKEPLPEPWTFGITNDGRAFFINDDEKITTWLHPDTGQPAMTGFQRIIDLPSGWEQAFAPEGGVYYINHNDRITTLEHPNKPTLTEEVNESALKKKKRRPSFTETLTRPLFRRSSSKAKTKPEKYHVKPKESIPSSARRSSVGRSKSIKMLVVRRDPNTDVSRSGWLYKQNSSGVGNVKIWRKRWFVLTDFCLFYYKDAKEDDVLGNIVLPSYEISTVNPDDKINRKYAFKIEHPGMRTYYISAESYNDMAEWIRILTPLCAFQPNSSKSGSRKSLTSKENNTSKITDEAVEFGFSEPRSPPNNQERNSEKSNSPPPKSDSRIVANGNNNNAKVSTSSSVSTPTSQLPRQQSRNSRQGRSSSASSRTYNSTTPSSGAPRRQSSGSSKRPARSTYAQTPRLPTQNGEYYYSDVSTPENKRPAMPNNRVERNNSMVKLGSWVQSQKQKQHSTNNVYPARRVPNTYDTASEMSSVVSPTRKGYSRQVQRAPSSNRRYKSGHYNDYMDPTEVASSVMSVPPMFRNKVMSLPRPRSSQDLHDKRSAQRRRMANSKSVGYISPQQELPPTTTRTKSDYNLPNDGHYADVRAPNSAHTPRRVYDDVFSPVSSNGYQDTRHFNYDPATSPTSPKSTYEVKQMDVRGKQGQLRAFAISAVKPSTNKAPAKAEKNLNLNMDKLDLSEDDIEAKLKKLNELDNIIHRLSDELNNLQNDKRRLEQSLQKAKSEFNSGNKSQFELEQNLSKVKSQLAKSTQKLKAMSKENESFEKEIRKLKSKLLEELNKGYKFESKSEQRQLEWELGRVEFMMEGVNKNKVGLVNKIESLRDDSQESDQTPPSSSRSSTNRKSYDYMMRSPRDVKRLSTDRRTSGGALHVRAPSSSSSVSQDSKYFTLPGHGVSHASSVDSLTAASLARYSRPMSGRTNLHRTKSAAERLLSGSHGNLTSVQDPSEIKRIQKEINQNRRRTLTGDFRHSRTLPRNYGYHDTHMQVGIDVQMAIKHHRMPKVLQRAKREMQRAEAERQPVKHDYDFGFDIDRFQEDTIAGKSRPEILHPDVTDDVPASPHKEEDLEPDELYVDVNLTHQLIAPDKVEIPDRLVDYEDIELSPEQEKVKQKKIRAIEHMLTRSGQTASRPTVHLAAALAAEAGSVARAVAYQAQQNKSINPSIV